MEDLRKELLSLFKMVLEYLNDCNKRLKCSNSPEIEINLDLFVNEL